MPIILLAPVAQEVIPFQRACLAMLIQATVAAGLPPVPIEKLAPFALGIAWRILPGLGGQASRWGKVPISGGLARLRVARGAPCQVNEDFVPPALVMGSCQQEKPHCPEFRDWANGCVGATTAELSPVGVGQ